MIFADKLMMLRKKKGYSQDQLADELDVSRQAVYKWETGANFPEMDKIKLMAELFKVSFDVLLDDNKDLDDEVAVTSNKPQRIRSVFNSGNEINPDEKGDLDHGYAKGRKFFNKQGDKYFKALFEESENDLKSKGYDDIKLITSDYIIFFFNDSVNKTIGFYFDGAEQFVCPYENIIEVKTSKIMANSFNWKLTINYRNENSVSTYELTLRPSLGYHIKSNSKMYKTAEDVEMWMGIISKQIETSLNYIIDKIRAIQILANDLKRTMELPEIDVEKYKQNLVVANEKKEKEMARLAEELVVLKKQRLVKGLIKWGIIGVALLVLIILML